MRRPSLQINRQRLLAEHRLAGGEGGDAQLGV